ncbi:MAG: hypothetical protein IJ689_04365 [Alphaproteobacteria bacterium]|nr:hypothetical protein [Alphaproteobacteria bacterium]
MKNYILMLGVAGVALGSYCAYAGNSATMTVTATIAHDVSLTKTQDLSLGTITINPAYDGSLTWGYDDDSGVLYNDNEGDLTLTNYSAGTFTANIPNPSACTGITNSCGGLTVTNGITNIFGGSDDSNFCYFAIKYSGSPNTFKVRPSDCSIEDVSIVTPGSHSGTLTISYTAS